MPKYDDRVRDVTTSTGAGAITVSGTPPARFAPFSGLTVGQQYPIVIEGQWESTEWELSLCTITSATTFTRDALIKGSNGNSFVNFSAGPKDVYVTLSAAQASKFSSVGTLPYSTAIPLTIPGASYMPQQTVTAPITFTVGAGAVQGALVYLRLVADGTNMPTFTGFKEWGGSLGYDNRNGIINEVQFFYDGYDYWFTVSQAVGAVPVDNTPPTAVSAAVANATPAAVVITMSEALDSGYVPAASAFTVTGHTVSSVAVSGSTMTLTCSAAFANGEAARTVSYVQPGSNAARDVAGNLLASFGPLAITNNVQPADTTAPTFASAQVADASPSTIVITMSEALGAVTPAASAWAASGKTVTAVGAPSGSTIALTVDTPYVSTDTITVTYTQPGTNKLQDVAGNAAASFGPSAVTNNVQPVAVLNTNARLNDLAKETESGTGPYTYTADGVAGSDFDVNVSAGITRRAKSVQQLRSGLDGYWQAKIAATGSGHFFGVTAQDYLVGYTSAIYGLRANSGGNYQPYTQGAASTAASTVAVADSDLVQFRRAGTTLYAEVSKNSGSTWTIIYTWSNVDLPLLSISYQGRGAAALTNVTTYGFAVQTGVAGSTRMTAGANITEVGVGPYSYVRTVAAAWGSAPMVCTQKWAASVDGTFEVLVSDYEVMVGLSTSSTPVSYSSYSYGIYRQNTNAVQAVTGGGLGTVNGTAVTVKTGDRIRLRRNSAATQIIAEHRAAGATTWTTIHTWSTASTGILYPQCEPNFPYLPVTVAGTGLS